MLIQTVDIPFRLPTMNEIIRLQSRMDRRTGHNEWNDLKKAIERKICFCLARAKVKRVERIDFFIYKWRCPDRRTDKSNVSSGGRKVFEDALVKYGMIRNDGWKEIGNWQDEFEVTDNYGVTVEMHSEDSQGEIDFKKRQHG